MGAQVRSGLAALATLVVACGDNGVAPDLGNLPSDGGVASDGGDFDGGRADAEPSDAGGALAGQIRAAESTALSHPACTAIAPFYWELGDVDGPIATGSQGAMYTADTELAIASASKWVFGAYVVERLRANLEQVDVNAMTMRSGYVSFDTCAGTSTVGACQMNGTNGDFSPAAVDRFAYGGGHFQKYAVDLGLGPMDSAALGAEYGRILGAEPSFAFNSPQLAGGMKSTATNYAKFLRKILAGELAIKDHLGENAACTLRGPSCPTAIGSPGDEAMHYSYGHWVEDQPDTGDGTFSSAGAFGFYPWINADKTLYGIVSRRVVTGGAGMDSLRCGRMIRKAFVTGLAQE